MKHIYITSLALSDLRDSGRAYVTALPPGEGVISTAYMRVEDAAQAVRETAGDAVPVAIYQTRWEHPSNVWGDVTKEVFDNFTDYRYFARRIVYAEPPTSTSADAQPAKPIGYVTSYALENVLAHGGHIPMHPEPLCLATVPVYLAAPSTSALPVERT